MPYHPLFLSNSQRDCFTAKLRPGNVHSVEDWDELLLPEIEREQTECTQVAVRADAAFAKPEIYVALVERRIVFAVRIPANESLEWTIAELLFRPPGSQPQATGALQEVRVQGAELGRSLEGSSPRSSNMRASCYHESALS